jgi:hypothetical protein
MQTKYGNCTFDSNYQIVHQKQNSECGMYCILFAQKMMNGDDFQKCFCDKKNEMPDEEVLKMRQKVFNMLH